MPFKKVRRASTSIESPEALFRDLKSRKVQGLLSHQADLLREYCEKKFLESQNVTLQLPTGSGKTLVGLLIGEWRRRKREERVVYLCPTRQLVHQVVSQSIDRYGIKANAFVGSQCDYSPQIKGEYQNSEALSVTTYSGLFNTNSFFANANVIIFDDAHSAENYIASYWSLLIEKNKQEHKGLFDALVSVLNGIISPAQNLRMNGDSTHSSDSAWIEKMPSPFVNERLSELIQVIDQYAKNIDTLKYSWGVIKDNLQACNIYLNSQKILIRPIIPPTHTHPPFKNPTQRIYMSATLGQGGELQRIFGIEKIDCLSIPKGWEKQGDGRRLFLFPERSLSEDDCLSLIKNIVSKTPRTLALVPDRRAEDQFKEAIKELVDYKIFSASQIEKSKKPFVLEDKAVAVVANRYDGIDLPDDECRLLIINGLQRSTNLQEQFLITRMPAAILYRDIIITRIIQAIGRCTRSATDYAAVMVFGQDLNKYLCNKEQRRLLHPEIQAEIEFGIEQSKHTMEEDFIDYFLMLTEHGEEWNGAEEDILSLRDECNQAQIPGIDKLSKTAGHEVKYQSALWRSDFEGAVEQCRTIITELSGDDVKGYRAFWYYLAGCAAWMGSKNGQSQFESIARDFFWRAANIVECTGIPCLYELARLGLADTKDDQIESARFSSVIEGLERKLTQLGTITDKRFESEVKFIDDNLKKENPDDSSKFEKAHEKLGEILGYQAGNDESTAAPDPWWIAGDDLCFVFEDHSSESDLNSSAIGANKVRQAASHPKWIKANNLLRKQATIIPVMITPYIKIDKTATLYAENSCYWNKSEFLEWASKAITVVRNLRRSFPGEADINWRNEARQKYLDAKLDPKSLREMLQNNPLKKLQTLTGKSKN